MGCLCFQIKLHVTDQPFDYWSEPEREKWFRQIKIKLRSFKSIYIYKHALFNLVVIILVCFGCHGIQMLDKFCIKWRYYPNMAISVDLGVKQQNKQTNKPKMYYFLTVVAILDALLTWY